LSFKKKGHYIGKQRLIKKVRWKGKISKNRVRAGEGASPGTTQVMVRTHGEEGFRGKGESKKANREKGAALKRRGPSIRGSLVRNRGIVRKEASRCRKP